MGNKVRIFQVLGKPVYNEFSYRFEESYTGRRILLSQFLAEDVLPDKYDNIEAIYLVPMSLYNDLDAIKKLVDKFHHIAAVGHYAVSKDKEGKEKVEKFSKLKDFGVRNVDEVIQGKEIHQVHFSIPSEFIYYSLLYWFVKSVLQEYSIIVDISTGLNVFTYRTIDALHRIVDFYNFSKGRDLKFQIAYMEPAIGTSSEEINVYMDSVSSSFKLGFPFSYPEVENLNKRVKANLNIDLKDIPKKAFFHYKAFVSNAPLFLFQYDRHSIDEIEGKIEEINDALRRLIEENYYSMIENGKLIVYSKTTIHVLQEIDKILEMLFLYMGMVRLLDRNGVPRKAKRVSTRKLKNFSEKVLKKELKAMVNAYVLEFELGERFEKEKYKTMMTPKFRPFITIRKGQDPNINEVEPRDFFAHAGLEWNAVEVSRRGEQVYLKYNEEFLKKKVFEILEK